MMVCHPPDMLARRIPKASSVLGGRFRNADSWKTQQLVAELVCTQARARESLQGLSNGIEALVRHE